MSLEVITGPMFAGKTRELLYRVKRAVMFGHRSAVVYVPELDTRHPVTSHDGERLDVEGVSVRVVPSDATALPYTTKTLRYFDLLVVDEAQFFKPHVANSIIEAAATNRVIVAGLDLDYAGNPFPPMDRLLSMADRVDKLTAVCPLCGDPATRSYRKTADRHKVVVGGAETYEARCFGHWRYTDEEMGTPS